MIRIEQDLRAAELNCSSESGVIRPPNSMKHSFSTLSSCVLFLLSISLLHAIGNCSPHYYRPSQFQNPKVVQTIFEKDFEIHKVVSSFTFTLPGSLTSGRFATTSWVPSRHLQGLVFIAHGFGEYLSSSSYDRLSHRLASKGFLVFGHDHLGHGHSSGERVQVVGSFSTDYVFPVLEHCHKVRRDHPELPLFIIGHSMGSLVSLLAVLEDDTVPKLFSGAVLMAPFVQKTPEMESALNHALTWGISKVLPSFQVGKIDLNHVTLDPKERKRLEKNPLNSTGVKAKQALAMVRALDYLKDRMNQVEIPILIQQGQDDKVLVPGGAVRLYKGIASKDKVLEIYPGGFHHLYIDLPEVRDAAIQDVVNWITMRS